jgi:large subunit ribosomal protein L9
VARSADEANRLARGEDVTIRREGGADDEEEEAAPAATAALFEPDATEAVADDPAEQAPQAAKA